MDRVKRTCEVCGGPLRRSNLIGVCHRNPQCKMLAQKRHEKRRQYSDDERERRRQYCKSNWQKYSIKRREMYHANGGLPQNHMVAENHPMWNGGHAKRSCYTCGKPVGWRTPAELKKHPRSFCGHRCLAMHMQQRRREMRSGATLVCAADGCGNMFYANATQIRDGRKYCSRSCSNKFRGKNP